MKLTKTYWLGKKCWRIWARDIDLWSKCLKVKYDLKLGSITCGNRTKRTNNNRRRNQLPLFSLMFPSHSCSCAWPHNSFKMNVFESNFFFHNACHINAQHVGCGRSRRSNSMTSQKTWINLMLRSFVPGTRQKSLPPSSSSRRNCTHRLKYWQILIFFIWNIKSPLNKHTHTQQMTNNVKSEREERLGEKKMFATKMKVKLEWIWKGARAWSYEAGETILTQFLSISNSKGKTRRSAPCQNRRCVSAVLAAINNIYFRATNFY